MSSTTKTTQQDEPPKKDALTPKSFLFKVLNGVALGIIVALLPNAVLGELMKLLIPYGDFFQVVANLLIAAQLTTPILVGALIGFNFKFNPIESATVAIVAFIGSGSTSFTENGWMIAGIGDLINTMIAASLAVGIILLIRNHLGSLTIVLLPMTTILVAGTISTYTLPYVRSVSTGLGNLINEFTTLQPTLMIVLIAISFSLIIVSPVSTIGLSVAIGIDGLAAGAANIGVAAAATSLVIGSFYKNHLGVPLAIALGAIKMMMPNVVRNPLILIPVVTSAATAGFTASFFSLNATTTTAGLGYIGLVGPVTAISLSEGSTMTAVIGVILSYVVVPVATAFLVDVLCRRVLKLYDLSIYEFKADES